VPLSYYTGILGNWVLNFYCYDVSECKSEKNYKLTMWESIFNSFYFLFFF
jgi:hypothetical protein